MHDHQPTPSPPSTSTADCPVTETNHLGLGGRLAAFFLPQFASDQSTGWWVWHSSPRLTGVSSCFSGSSVNRARLLLSFFFPFFFLFVFFFLLLHGSPSSATHISKNRQTRVCVRGGFRAASQGPKGCRSRCGWGAKGQEKASKHKHSFYDCPFWRPSQLVPGNKRRFIHGRQRCRKSKQQ